MPTLRLAVYNVKWMGNMFSEDGSPKTFESANSDEDQEQVRRSHHLAAIVKRIDPDVLCIAEGPTTIKDKSKTASSQLEAWLDLHGLGSEYSAMHGFRSPGQQELCAIFKQEKVDCAHCPERRKRKHPFNKEFVVTSPDNQTNELHTHYRPPLEIAVQSPDGKTELMRIILAHTKALGVFASVGFERHQQVSEFNRRKLYAECFSIRQRCNQWLKED